MAQEKLKDALVQFMTGTAKQTNKEKGDAGGDRQTEATTAGSERDSSQRAGSAADTPADEGPPIELDQVFGLLRNRRRRDVLRYLSGTDEQVRIGKLAETIAARECDKPVRQITSQERKRVYIGLYQGHLPKMDDCGVVEYNQQRGIIDRGPNYDVLVGYLPDEESVPGKGDGR